MNIKINQNMKDTNFTSIKPMKVLKEIQVSITPKTNDFINRLSNTRSEDIIKFLQESTKNIKIRDEKAKLFHKDNLLFYLSDGPSSYMLEQNLGFVDKFAHSPKVVKYLQLGDEEFLTILIGDTEKLTPINRCIDRITNVQKQEFKNNMAQLAKSGIVNNEIAANKDPLFFAESSKKILYGDWSNISFKK